MNLCPVFSASERTRRNGKAHRTAITFSPLHAYGFAAVLLAAAAFALRSPEILTLPRDDGFPPACRPKPTQHYSPRTIEKEFRR